MKKQAVWAFASFISAAALCASLSSAAFASNNPYAALEARNRKAIETAVAAGTVPAGTGVYDCMYHTGEDGVMRVVKYKDSNGKWIDVTTGDAESYLQGTFTEKLSDETLEEYAADVFRLVNEAREEAGLEPLERDAELDEAALIRAEELNRKFSHERPDGTGFQTVLGKDIHCYYAENGGSTGDTPEEQVSNWLNSDGHRTNILDLKRRGYIKIGVGIYQDGEGDLFWCQLFTSQSDE